MNVSKWYITALLMLLFSSSIIAQDEVKLLLQEPLGYEYDAFLNRKHTNIEATAISSDGKWVATSSEMHTIIWDMASKLQINKLPKMIPWLEIENDSGLTSWNTYSLKMAFVPGSNLLVGIWRFSFSFGKGIANHRFRTSLMVWDWKNGRLLKQVRIKQRYVTRNDYLLTCSQDGSKLLFGFKENYKYFHVMAWSISRLELLFEKKYQVSDYPYSLYFSRLRLRILPDNNRFAIGLIPDENRPITYDKEVVPTFIHIRDLSTGKLERSFTPQNEWANYRLLDYAFSPSGEYLHAVYMQDSLIRDSLYYHVVRWETKSGRLAPKKGLGDFYAKIKLGDQGNYIFNYNKVRYLSQDGQYFYTPYEGVLDLHTSKPAGSIFQLEEKGNYYPEYPIQEAPVPGFPTTIVNTNHYQAGPRLIDLLTGESENFSFWESGHRGIINRVIFGHNGLLFCEYDELRHERLWWDLSYASGEQYRIETKQLVGTAINPMPTTGNSWFINRDWFSIEFDGRRKSDQSYFFNINTREIINSSGITRPDAISPSGKWLTGDYDKLFKFDEKEGNYVEKGSYYQHYKASQPVFTHKEDFCYYSARDSLWRCRLPGGNHAKNLGVKTGEQMIISPDDQWVILLYEQSIEVFDTQAKRIVRTFPGHARDVQFSPDGQQLWIAFQNRVDFFSVPTFKQVGSLQSGLDGITSFDVDPEGRRIAIAGPRKIEIRDLSDHQLVVTFVGLPDGGYLFYTPDHYYAINKGEEHNIAFRRGDDYFSFEQFDLYYNRPDIIMERLGYASPAYLQTLKKAHQKRLEKLGLSETAVKPGLHLPTVQIANKEALPMQSNRTTISLDIRASDITYPLSRLLISVNEIPLIDLNARKNPELASRNYSQTFDLKLVAPRNMIEVQVWNKQGVPSVKAKHFIRLDKAALDMKPDLYVATVGVSHYKDQRMDLRYAAKDAKDVRELFTDRRGSFARIHTFQLLDSEVTKENIQALKVKLQQSRPQDRVILFVAGHGLLDKNLDFYFGTHDVDFENPSRRGMAFTELEDVVTGLAARQKILLMDACNSGELDKGSTALKTVEQNTEEGTVSFRAFGTTRVREKEGVANSFSLMKDLFVDLRRKSGAVIISAASGAEAAIEGGQFSNGVFTYALMEGMGAGRSTKLPADDNEDERITISELQKYVLTRVPELTNGKQRPTSRVEYLYNDFVLWDVKGAKGIGDISWRDLDFESLKRYVDRGGSINDKDGNGATLLMQVVYNSDDPELARWLIRQGANPRLKGTIPLERTGYYGSLTSIAAAQGKLEMLRFLIEECKIPVDDREYDEDDQSETGWTALQWAANNGHLKVVKYLISKGAKINMNSVPGESTPLMLAARYGHLEVLKSLMEAGAQINMADQVGYTALHYAARYGQPENVKYLIQQGATLNQQINQGWTPLMLAGINEHYYCFEHLLQAGADTQIKNKDGKTLNDLAQEYARPAVQELITYQKPNRPFFLAIKQQDKESVLDFLKQGASLDIQDAYGASMFMHIVSEFDTLDVIKEVMTYQPNLQLKGVIWSNRIGGGYYGNLQCIAAGKGKMEILRYLLENLNLPVDEPEYDPSDQSLSGWTALQWATSQRNWKCIIYLIDKGANKNVGISDGDTPALLYWGGTGSSIEVDISNLLITPENVNSKTSQGWTLWHFLARAGWHQGYVSGFSSDTYYFDPLRRYGGNPNAQDDKGWTPLMLAANNGHEKFLNVLNINKKGGADPDLTNEEGWTALMIAAEQGHASTCRELVDYSADCDLSNHDGETALDIARRKGHTEIVADLERLCE